MTQIVEASAGRPYLGLTMELDLRVIAQLKLNDDRPPGRSSEKRLGVAVGDVSPPLLGAFDRLLDLLEHPHELAERLDASKAASEVGYESPSQFSQGYSRLFGWPPMRDIKHLVEVSAG